MKIRDLIGSEISEAPWYKEVGQAAKDGWTKGGPIAKADPAIRKSKVAGWADKAMDKFAKTHGNYRKPSELGGILPGQAMGKGGKVKPGKEKGKSKYDPNTGKKL